jgi:hypothetical protein
VLVDRRNSYADQLGDGLLRQPELQRRGSTRAELGWRRKGDAEKVKIAWRSRQATTMTLKWIARRFRMGAWTYVSNCLVKKRMECNNV